MRKTGISRLAGVMAAVLSTTLLLTGCGSKEIVLYGTEEEYGKADLCDYTNLSVNKNVYEITDEMVDDEVENLLYDYVEYKEVDRPSEEEDYITVTMKASADGEVIYDFTNEEEGGYEFSLGYEEFGPAFDEELTGVSKGDTLSFSIPYDADSEFEEFAGKTIDYDVTVKSINEEVMPTLTDEFISTLGYDSEDALRKSLKDDLTKEYEDSADMEMQNALLTQIIDSSTFNSYPDELLTACKANVEQNYSNYMEMFGVSTVNEIYEMFGITDEDIEQEALNQVYQMITLNQIAREQDMKISQKDYDEKIKQYAADMEYDSVNELTEEYGEDNLKLWIMEEMVYDYLVSHASITEVPASLENNMEFEDDYSDEDDSDEIFLDDTDFEDDGEDIDFDFDGSDIDLDFDEEDTGDDDGDFLDDDSEDDLGDDSEDDSEDDLGDDETADEGYEDTTDDAAEDNGDATESEE